MKVRQEILEKIDNPQARTRIAVKVGIGEQAVAYQFRNNASNGRLTKMDFVQAISEEVGCGIEEILESESEPTHH